VIPSGPDQNINFIYESLLAIFSKAEKYVTIITPYLVPDETIINVLKNISLLGIKSHYYSSWQKYPHYSRGSRKILL